MKKKTWIILSIMIILVFGFFRMINPRISKDIASLDCKATYQMSIFEREYEGFNYHNGKMDLAKCLCTKYSVSKNEKYKLEIKKILREFEYESANQSNIDDICTNSETYFAYWYYEWKLINFNNTKSESKKNTKRWENLAQSFASNLYC